MSIRAEPTLEASLLDDLFQACALHAFVEEFRRAGELPESDAVKFRAYRYYEDSLRARH